MAPMSIRPALVVLALALAVSACGKEAGRIRLPAEGSGAVIVMLEAGEVAATVRFALELPQGADLTELDLFPAKRSTPQGAVPPRVNR